MLNLRPLGSTVRLENRLTRLDAAIGPLGVFTSAGADVDALLPGERDSPKREPCFIGHSALRTSTIMRRRTDQRFA
jgi:hypothetical protein